jgi:hypothetical protein
MNKTVIAADTVFIILFVFILEKSNKNRKEKRGISVIPINPECDNI